MKRKLASLLMVSALAVSLLLGYGNNKVEETDAIIEEEIVVSVKEEEATEEIPVVEEDVPEESDPDPYPNEITLDTQTEDGLKRFVSVLEWTEYYKRTPDTPLSWQFLIYSMTEQDLVSAYQGVITQNNDFGYACVFDKNTVEAFLKDSLGDVDITDVTSMFGGEVIWGEDYRYEDGYLYMSYPDTDEYDIRNAAIQKVTALSEDTILVEGSVERWIYDGSAPEYTRNFRITLTANPNSIWGGYTLKEINSWDN